MREIVQQRALAMYRKVNDRVDDLAEILKVHLLPHAVELKYLEHVPPQLNQGDSRGAEDGRGYRH